MATVQERTVQVRAEVMTLPTYELLREDLNPILDKHLNPYPSNDAPRELPNIRP